jgi:YVTN family beta-propeller protein
MLGVMNWNLPVWRASIAGVAPLAAASPAAPGVPVTVFESMRAAMRRARRAPTLVEVADNGTAYDVPLLTPSAPVQPAPVPPRTMLGSVAVGRFPTGLAVSPDGNHVYAANTGDDTVSVIDAAGGNPAITIAVGRAPYGIALTPDGRRGYVVNAGSNSVSIIDMDRQVVTKTVAVGARPYGVALSPDGEFLCVTNQGDGTLTVVGDVRWTVDVGGAPTGVAVSPTKRLAYVVDNDTNRLVVVDTDAGAVVASIPVGDRPAQIAVTPDGAQAFVTNAEGGSVSVVDLSALTVIATIPVSAHPIGVAVGADGRFAYITALNESYMSGTVTIVDIATGMKSTSHAGAPYGIAADPGGDYAYVTDFRAHTVSLIEAAAESGSLTNALTKVGSGLYALPIRKDSESSTVRAIPLDRGASGVTTDPNLARAFVIRSGEDTVEVIEPTGRSVRVDVGRYPSAVVLSRDGARAYVTNYEDGTVSVIDTDQVSDSCNTVLDVLDVGMCWSTGVMLSADGSRGYIVDEADGHLSVIDTAPQSPSRDTLLGHIELVDPPAALRLSPNGRWVYAINHFDHAVWAVHTNTNRMTTIRLPAYPYRLSVSPSGLRVYATLSDGATYVIDSDPDSPKYHHVIARLPIGGHGPEPVFTTAGERAYVVKSDHNAVAVVDTMTSAVKKVAVGAYPWDLAVSTDGRRAYVTNCLDGSLSIISCATDMLTATVPVGVHPSRVALSGDGKRAFVVNNRGDSLTVVDTSIPSVSDTVMVGRNPFDVDVSADGTRAFVHHRDGLSLVSL